MREKFLGAPLYLFFAAVLVGAILFVAWNVFAWTSPPSNPPAGNVAAPVNIGSAGQVKAGDFATQGKLGVGTPSPGAKFHVLNSGSAYSIFETTGAGAYGGLQFVNSGLNSFIGTASNGMYFYAGDGTTEDMTILNGGNVGIGTGAPGYKLTVSGVMQAQRYYDDDAGYYIDSNGDSQMNTVYANAFYYRSDARLKKNVRSLDGALAKVLALDGVIFNWTDGTDGGVPQIGFIAQDVERVVPALVTTSPNTGMKAVDYSKVGPLLVNALKEQEQKIADQQRQLDELRKEIEALKK